jgi:hypothetical protein
MQTTSFENVTLLFHVIHKAFLVNHIILQKQNIFAVFLKETWAFAKRSFHGLNVK